MIGLKLGQQSVFITWTGPTAGSSELPVGSYLDFTVPGSYILTVNIDADLIIHASGGGAHGGFENDNPGVEKDLRRSGTGGGNGQNTATGTVKRLFAGRSYTLVVGDRGFNGGATSLYDPIGGFVVNLGGGGNSTVAGVSTYENGLSGGSYAGGSGGGSGDSLSNTPTGLAGGIGGPSSLGPGGNNGNSNPNGGGQPNNPGGGVAATGGTSGPIATGGGKGYGSGGGAAGIGFFRGGVGAYGAGGGGMGGGHQLSDPQLPGQGAQGVFSLSR